METACYGGVLGYRNISHSMSHPLGLRLPNENGIYDLSGNIWEWCYDGFVDYVDLLSEDQPIYSPVGSHGDKFRVMRGGSWASLSDYCQLAFRLKRRLNFKDNVVGFRLARSI